MAPKTGTSTEPLAAADVEAIRLLREQQAGPPAVLVFHGRGAEHVSLPEGRSVTLGREAEIAIDDGNLSRSHARLVNEGGSVVLEDLGSTNGSWLGGERVRRAVLRPDDAVCIGSPRVVAQLLATRGHLVSPIGSHDAFLRAAAREVAAANERGDRAAVIVTRSHIDRTHLHRWYERTALVLPPHAICGLYAPDTLEILVPGTDLRDAGDLARRLCDIQASYGTVLVAGAASFPEAAADAMQLLAAALDALEQAAQSPPVKVAPLRAASRSGGGAPTDPVLTGAFFEANERTLLRLARSPAPLLLLGATGTGKEVVARLLHDRGPRVDRPFIAVHCGALPEGLLASELFGHVRGAFSGATTDKEGLFRAASGGTIFLDEIGEAPPAVQVSLLRALEARAVRPVGGTKEIPVDVRVIAATHRDLEAMALAGRFREDLYYRLCVLSFVLPRLLERKDEIEPLALRFLAEANAVAGGQVTGISAEALDLLRRHDWPGNIRELRNTLRRAAVLAESDLITPDDLPDAVRRTGVRPSSMPPPPSSSPAPAEQGSLDLREKLRAEQRAQMLDALRRTNQNQTKAAELLGIPRRTFVYRMNQGIVAVEATHAGQLNEIARGVPLVVVDFAPTAAAFDAVEIDHFQAGYLAARHLLALGHRRVAYIGEGPLPESSDPSWQHRLSGYIRALVEAGLPAGPELILDVRRNVPLVQRLLPEFHRRVQPGAYVVATAGFIEPIMQLLATLGASVPGQVSLVAADSSNVKAGALEISQVRADYEMLGRQALRLLATRIACKAMPPVKIVQPVAFQPAQTSASAQ